MHSSRELSRAIERALQGRNEVIIERHTLAYHAGEWELLRIASAAIDESRAPVLLIQAGIHGDEIAGPIALARHAGELFDRAHARGVRLIIYPLANPSGFDRRQRYAADHRAGDPGNGDFLRYELEDGSCVDELPEGAAFRRWHWSSDQVADLPAETVLLQQLLKREPLGKIRAVLDLHQDYLTPNAPPAAYHYAFGDFARYQPIVDHIRARLPILAHTRIDAGYASSSAPAPVSDKNGFLLRHDGSLTDLFHRLGADHAITAETTGATPLDLAVEINLLWIDGLLNILAQLELED